MLYASLDEVYKGYTPPPKKKKSKEKKVSVSDDRIENMSDLRDDGVGGMLCGANGMRSDLMGADITNQKMAYNNDHYDMDIPMVKTSPNHMVKEVNGQNCTLSAAPYTYPIQPEAMKEYQEAVEVSLNYDQNKIVKSSLNTLRSYNEDDLDQYFDVDPSSLNNDYSIKPKNIKQTEKTGHTGHTGNTGNTEQRRVSKNPPLNTKKNVDKKKKTNTDKKFRDDKLYEFLLFVFIGFIIIALCEIIVSLARYR